MHKSPIRPIGDLCFFFFLFCITKSYDIQKTFGIPIIKANPSLFKFVNK